MPGLLLGIIAAIVIVALILRNTAAGVAQPFSAISEAPFRRMSRSISFSGRLPPAMALMLSSGMDVTNRLQWPQNLWKVIQRVKRWQIKKMNDATVLQHDCC